MHDPYDPLPPGAADADPVGAVVGNETLALALADPTRPPLPPPIADVLGVCPRCWYGHGPDEECPR